MTKKSKAVFIVLTLLILAGVAVFLLCTNQENFTGSRVKNPDAYLLDIEKMNGTDLHTLELLSKDANYVSTENLAGILQWYISVFKMGDSDAL